MRRAEHQVQPNSSLRRSANGWSPSPRGDVVHHVPRGPGVHPSSPGQLCVRRHDGSRYSYAMSS